MEGALFLFPFSGVGVQRKPGMLKIKRIYDLVEKEDGYRLLVDRLWPRGIQKEEAMLDDWNKEIIPSRERRRDFHHGMKVEDFRHY